MTHGQFAFTTGESGTYFACLSMHHDQTHYTFNSSAIVSLDWKMGIRTKDWDSVAKKEKIEASPYSFPINNITIFQQKKTLVFIYKYGVEYVIVVGCGA